MRSVFVTLTMVMVSGITACSGSRPPEGAASAASSPSEDLQKLQGKWRIESSMWNGVEDPPIAKSVTILFEGDKFVVVDIDGKRQEEKIRLFSDQNPKAIDCTSKGGGQPSPGIYVLEGNTFKWCSAGGSNKVRPTTFASQPGSKQSLMIMRREKS